MLSDLAKELKSVCDDSVNISLNVWVHKDNKEDVTYQVYVSNKVNKSFKSYTELEKFITFLVAELRKIDVKAVENSIQKAYDLLKLEGTVVL
jgi:hypothetical protein